MEDRWLIIGIGSKYRCDDGVGPAVVAQLQRENVSADLVLATGEGSELLRLWRDCRRVILVDAVQAAGNPGQLYRLDGRSDSIRSRFFNYSTHAFSLAEALALGKVLGQLPELVLVFGIEGRRFDFGETLSPEIEAAVDRVVTEICQLVEREDNSFTTPNLSDCHQPMLPPFYS